MNAHFLEEYQRYQKVIKTASARTQEYHLAKAQLERLNRQLHSAELIKLHAKRIKREL